MAIATGIVSLVGAGISAYNEKKANEARIKEAAVNREFQERMSSTSYQRGMEDMRLAGLNPILAYKQGGASSPIGSMAVPQNIAPQMGELATKAIQAGSARKVAGSTAKLAAQQALQMQGNTMLAVSTAKKVASETAAQNIANYKASLGIRGAELEHSIDASGSGAKTREIERWKNAIGFAIPGAGHVAKGLSKFGARSFRGARGAGGINKRMIPAKSITDRLKGF